MNTLTDLLNKGELPTVTVDVKLNKDNMIDLAVTAIIAGLVVLLLNKLILTKI